MMKLFKKIIKNLSTMCFSFGAMATQQAALEEQKNQATAKQLDAEQEAQLRRQKKQEAIDARLYR